MDFDQSLYGLQLPTLPPIPKITIDHLIGGGPSGGSNRNEGNNQASFTPMGIPQQSGMGASLQPGMGAPQQFGMPRNEGSGQQPISALPTGLHLPNLAGMNERDFAAFMASNPSFGATLMSSGIRF